MESDLYKGLEKQQCGICKSCLSTKCDECDIPTCQKCCSLHQRETTANDTKSESNSFIQTNSKCDIHSTEDLVLYCDTCKICICIECSKSGHTKHEFINVKDIAQQMEQRLSETLASIRFTQIPLLKAKVKSVENSKEENKKQGEATAAKIHSRMDELVHEIDKLRQKLIEECQDLQMQNDKHLNELEKLLTENLSNMERLYNECKQVLVFGSDIDKILIEKQIHLDLTELNSHDTDMVLALPMFYPGKTDIRSFQKSFGFVDTQMVSSSDFEASIFTEEEANIEILSTFNHKSKDVLSIQTLPHGNAWVHCRGEFDNEEINSDGIIKNTISFEYMANDFVAISNNEILVSAGNTTFIYKKTLDNKTVDEIDTSPLQSLCLCVSKDGNILVGLVEKWSFTIQDNSRRLVARMTTGGEMLETYEYDGESRLFVLLWGLAENKNGDICVVNKTSMTNGHLVILDETGKHKVTYNCGHMEKYFDATDVECDKLGFIIVSDCRNRKLHLLNADGQLMQYLMTGKDLSYKPDALCLDKHGNLWIGCHGGQILIIKYLD